MQINKEFFNQLNAIINSKFSDKMFTIMYNMLKRIPFTILDSLFYTQKNLSMLTFIEP